MKCNHGKIGLVNACGLCFNEREAAEQVVVDKELEVRMLPHTTFSGVTPDLGRAIDNLKSMLEKPDD